MAPIGVIERSPHPNTEPRAGKPDGRRGGKLLITDIFSEKPLGVAIAVALAIAVFISVVARTPDVDNTPEQLGAGIAIDDYWLELWGYIYDVDGVTPILDCTVIVTNTNTSESIQTTSYKHIGVYQINLDFLPSNWEAGNIINVTATKGAQIGWNETTISWDGFWPMWPSYPMNVTMSAGIPIPEFSSPVMIAGMTVVMMAVLIASRSRREKSPQGRRGP